MNRITLFAATAAVLLLPCLAKPAAAQDAEATVSWTNFIGYGALTAVASFGSTGLDGQPIESGSPSIGVKAMAPKNGGTQTNHTSGTTKAYFINNTEQTVTLDQVAEVEFKVHAALINPGSASASASMSLGAASSSGSASGSVPFNDTKNAAFVITSLASHQQCTEQTGSYSVTASATQ